MGSFIFVNINSLFIQANTLKSIYGEDNRILARELNSQSPYQLSILAQIPDYRITNSKTKGILSIKTKSLKDGLNFCESEKFLDEPIVSSCTAFLIQKDVILTAGHCVKDKFDCKKQTWVFDYTNSADNLFQNFEISFLESKSVKCIELISHAVNQKSDYAIIKINKKIEDRPFLKLNQAQKTSTNASFFMLGHPLGMPLIQTDQIQIRENHLEHVFKTNADSFSGNSGSPLINLETGLVEGILIRGDEDYYLDKEKNCHATYRCANKECRGETFLRSSAVKNI